MSQRSTPKLDAIQSSYDVEPFDDEEWAAILSIFPSTPLSKQDLLAHADALTGRSNVCGKHLRDVQKDFARGLKNPNLTTDDIAEIDSYYADAEPVLNGCHTTDNFAVKYVNDKTNTKDYITSDLAVQIGAQLEEYYATYTKMFGRSPALYRVPFGEGPNPIKLQVVKVYQLSKDDGSSYYNSSMLLSTSSMKIKSNMQFTTAHELFHYLESAYGMDIKLYTPKEQAWFVEGMANWGAVYLTNGIVDDSWKDFKDFDSVSIFRAGYNAFPFWIYVSGFVNPSVSTSPFWPIASFLDAYEHSGKPPPPDSNQKLPIGDPLEALQTVLDIALRGIKNPPPNSIGALLAAYSRAKCSNQWRAAGEGYERPNTPMGWVSDLTYYGDGEPFEVPELEYSEEIALEGYYHASSGRIANHPAPGTSLIYKIALSPPLEKDFVICQKILTRVDSQLIYSCIGRIDADGAVDNGAIVSVSGEKPANYTLLLYGEEPGGTLVMVVSGGYSDLEPLPPEATVNLVVYPWDEVKGLEPPES